MPSVSQTQDNFLGGRWSLYAQGRWKHPKYQTALSESLNGLPLEEGAWTRRSGTWHMGTTLDGHDGRLIDFDFTEPTPYKIELTNGNIRLWASTGLVYNATALVTNVDSSSPAIITVVPSGFGTLTAGQQVQFLFSGTAPSNAPLLQNRTFTLVAAGAADGTQWTLEDAISGAAVNAPLAWSSQPGTIVMAQVLQIPASVYSTNWALDQSRFVQTGVDPDGTVTGEGVLLSSTQAPFILECIQSQPLGPQFATFALSSADFIDGPYLDPVPTGIWGNATGVATQGPVIVSPWNSTTAYVAGNIVSTPSTLVDSGYPVDYDGAIATSVSVTEWICLIDNTDFNPQNYAWGTTLPAAGRYWAGLNNLGPWSSTTTYQAGDQVTVAVTSMGVTTTTLYTCILQTGQTSVDQAPASTPSVWSVYNSADVNTSGSGLGPGSILFTIFFQTWSNSTSYNLGDVVTYADVNYQSLADGNYDNTPGSSSAWQAITTIPGVNGGAGFLGTDVGRAIRLYSEPPPWASGTAYVAGNNVQYPFGSQTYWTAQTSNTGVTPGTNIADWLPAVNASQWAWGRITQVQNSTNVIVSLIGMSPFWTTQGALDTLLYTNSIYTWELGVYSNSTGWPSTGCYQGGRLWLSGALPNRIDSSVSNGIRGTQINFAPTNYDNTVGDSNGVSLVLNSDTLNQVQWLKPYNGGIGVGTLHNEWFITASQLQDPITPATAQVNAAGQMGSKNVEPVVAPIAMLFVQKLGRKVMELMQDVFTGRFRSPNLSVFAKDLSEPGIEEIRYQEEIAPLIWSRMLDGSWAGCTYRRISQYVGGEQDIASEAAIVGWHRHVPGTGRVLQSIMVGPNAGGTLDTLSMVTNQATTGQPDTGVRHVETMIDLFEEDDSLLTAWYLDDAIVPSSIEVTSTGVVLNGLWDFNGLTKTVWGWGLDLGDFLVTNGSITVPYGSAGPAPAQGSLFTKALVESNQGNYTEFASNCASVAITPAGNTYSPATVQWYVDQQAGHPGLSNTVCVPNWDAGLVYFGERDASGNGYIAVFNIASGEQVGYHTSAALGLTGGVVLQVGTPAAACLGQDGYLYWLTSNSGIARINTSEWTVSYQPTDLDLTIEGLVPVVSTDGIQYLAAGISNGLSPGSMCIINGYTGQLVSGASFTAPEGSNPLMTVGSAPVINGGSLATPTLEFGGPVLEDGVLEIGGPIPAQLVFPAGPGGTYMQSASPGTVFGTATNGTSPPTTMPIYRGIVGTGGTTTFDTFVTIAATTFGPLYTTLQAEAPIIVDQTDGNLIHIVTMNNNDTWIYKLTVSNGTVIWKTLLPSGNISTNDAGWHMTRAAGGIVSLMCGQNLCVINTTTGALTTTAMGSGNGQLDGGQSSDAITGKIITHGQFSAGTNLLDAVGTNGTPSGFTYQWFTLVAGNAFTGAVAVQTNYSGPVIVGSCFTSTMTTLRPINPQEAGTVNGPAMGKTVRSNQYAALLANSMGASTASGATSRGPLATPFPIRYQYPNGVNYAPNVLYNGIVWDLLQADYALDDTLLLTVTRPYPTTVAATTSFKHGEDRS